MDWARDNLPAPSTVVIPAKAGIHSTLGRIVTQQERRMDPDFRQDDGEMEDDALRKAARL